MAAGARDWLALPGRTAAALRVQGFDKGPGPVGLLLIGQACQLPAWPDQGPREGSLVKSRSGQLPAQSSRKISGGEAATFCALGSAGAAGRAFRRRTGRRTVQVAAQFVQAVGGVAGELRERGAEAAGVASQPPAEELQQLS